MKKIIYILFLLSVSVVSVNQVEAQIIREIIDDVLDDFVDSTDAIACGIACADEKHICYVDVRFEYTSCFWYCQSRFGDELQYVTYYFELCEDWCDYSYELGIESCSFYYDLCLERC